MDNIHCECIDFIRIPALTVGLFLLTFDRLFGANFFDPSMGGNVVIWEHLFWIFGHPEVYILILPAFGVFSEVIPTFSKNVCLVTLRWCLQPY